MKRIAILVFLSFAFCTAAAVQSQPTAPPDAKPATPLLVTDDDNYMSAAIGFVPDFPGKLGIYPSLRNRRDEPGKAVFFVDPAFIFAYDSGGNPAITVQQQGGDFIVELTLVISSDDICQKALRSIVAKDTPLTGKIDGNNIATVPVKTIAVSVPDLATWNLKGVEPIRTQPFNIAKQPQDTYAIQFRAKTKEQAEELKKRLATTTVELTYSFVARGVEINRVEVTWERLQQSTLYEKLNGLNTTSVTVHRDSMRRLMDGIASQVINDRYLERPDVANLELTKLLLDYFKHEEQIALDKHDKQLWQACFDLKDLEPDVIEREINKAFDVTDTTIQRKIDAQINLKGGIPLLFDVDITSANNILTYL